MTFNKVNTYQWYKQKVYKVETAPDYKPNDKLWAFKKSLEWDEKIPIGVIYQDTTQATYEDQVAALKEGPLVNQNFNSTVTAAQEKLLNAFC